MAHLICSWVAWERLSSQLTEGWPKGQAWDQRWGHWQESLGQGCQLVSHSLLGYLRATPLAFGPQFPCSKGEHHFSSLCCNLSGNVNAVPDCGKALEVRGRDPFNLLCVSKASISGGLPTPGATNLVHVATGKGLTDKAPNGMSVQGYAQSITCNV